MTSRPFSICIYGDFTWDRLAASFRRAFEELGHAVVPLDTQFQSRYLAPWLGHRIGHRLTIRSLALRRLGSERWTRSIAQTARESGSRLLLVLGGEFVMRETLEALRDRGVKVFISHPDTPFPPHYNHRPELLPAARAS